MARLRDTGHGYDWLAAPGGHAAAVVARPGFALQRVRLATPVAHDLAFELITQHLRGLGLPTAALCGVELRAPEQATGVPGDDYRGRYRRALEQLGVTVRGNTSPVARSTLCPIEDPPHDVSIHAFSYAAPAVEYRPGGLAPLDRTFVLSAVVEAPDVRPDRIADIVARGDLSSDGLQRKLAWVVSELGDRLHAIRSEWDKVTDTHLYSVRDVGALVPGAIHPATGTVTWHQCQPPLTDLEVEMDCRRVANELVLDPAVS